MIIVLDIVIYIFSILGGVVTIITLYQFLRPLKKVEWKDVEKGVRETKEKLVENNYIPTLIVGIGRGGSIVGALLSGCLGHIPIVVIDRVYQWDQEGRHEQLFGRLDIDQNLDRVLLTAGELHTGGTAKAYIKYFNKLGAKEIKFFSFLKEKFPTIQPDYYCIVSDNPEVKLPWMLLKTYKRDSKHK